MRTPIDPLTPAAELHELRGDYGVDAPLTGFLPPTVGGLTLGALSVYHGRHGRRSLAIAEFLSSMPMLFTAFVYLHATRRGKFQIWADLLKDLHLRGDEHCLDMGCGRGAVTAMLAKLVPCGGLWASTSGGRRINPATTPR